MGSGSDREPSAAAPAGRAVVVTGAASELGRRVCELAAADPQVTRVVALDRRGLRGLPAEVDGRRVDLASDDLKELFEGADAVVHLAQPDGPRRGGDLSAPTGEAAMARHVLEAAGSAGVPHVVLLSSALVYGAWANNPVPLTEDAPLRPNPDVAMAAEKAELERAALEWKADHPGSTVALLRPAVTVSAAGNPWLARALSRSSGLPVTEDEPPAQYLDVADLASAVDLARRVRLDGPRNVAPDGWVDGETVRALAGGVPRLRLPERLAVRITGLRWRWGMAETPPELLPYTLHPWVVANDRLVADGWRPASSNEEAFVGAHRAGPWATMSPRRRQELALAVAGTSLVGLLGGAVGLVRRGRRG
ncbi:MAG: NAD-dependent epimerase/dehydratase family protein [Acidimicrobiia bacterium]|jgi:nucleoside-diphosphate-sugar epimerase